MCVFARGSSDEAFLLEPGKSRGTAGYMSPEHAKGKPLDKRTVRQRPPPDAVPHDSSVVPQRRHRHYAGRVCATLSERRPTVY